MLRFFISILLLMILACGEAAPKETRADRIAKGLCDCTSNLLDINKQAVAADSIDFEGIQTAFNKTKACIINQRLKADDLPEVEKVLGLHCPALAAEAELLEELLAPYRENY